ncbi:alpha/beta-hydrolase [Auricularia subglabra TFB-10046 SS5]|nr:alpha/beta-hydrolase [Auricularia subglabra TFB-10046 SS5]
MRFFAVATSVAYAQAFVIKPFKVNLGSEIPRLRSLLSSARITPPQAVPGSDNAALGIPPDRLAELRNEWVALDWKAQEKALNAYKQYTTIIDNTTIHFLHERSSHAGAIPIIITHGWPGSFAEYLPVVKLLTQGATVTTSTGQKKFVSFDVIIPSLPGYVFSSVPATQDARTLENIARTWNTLVVDVLGYKRGYAVAGSDWGGPISWHIYDLFPQTVRAAYLNFLPVVPPTRAQIEADGQLQNVTDFEIAGAARTEESIALRNGYFLEQATKPNTIGLALQDSPVGQLAWMGDVFVSASDPNGGLTSTDILTGVSLYYLSRSFLSSVFLYANNGLDASPRKARNNAPFGYGNFKWENVHWPRYVAAQLGNFVFYKEHSKGGRFPGLDNPAEWISDVRTMMAEHFKFTS